MTSLRWRRGAFRLWIVGTALWFIYWIVFISNVWHEMLHPMNELMQTAPYIVGPPLLLLAIGAAIGWAIEGFCDKR